MVAMARWRGGSSSSSSDGGPAALRYWRREDSATLPARATSCAWLEGATREALCGGICAARKVAAAGLELMARVMRCILSWWQVREGCARQFLCAVAPEVLMLLLLMLLLLLLGSSHAAAAHDHLWPHHHEQHEGRPLQKKPKKKPMAEA